MSNYCSKGHWENGMTFPCKQCEIERLRQRVAELEAVLRECREALVPYMKYVDGTSVLNHPAQCVAKIDEVLNVPDNSRTA